MDKINTIELLRLLIIESLEKEIIKNQSDCEDFDICEYRCMITLIKTFSKKELLEVTKMCAKYIYLDDDKKELYKPMGIKHDSHWEFRFFKNDELYKEDDDVTFWDFTKLSELDIFYEIYCLIEEEE